MPFSEAVQESGTFVSVIASAAATGIMSNIQWPCTDIDVGFGTIAPGDSVARTALVGLGLGGRDVEYERISELL